MPSGYRGVVSLLHPQTTTKIRRRSSTGQLKIGCFKNAAEALLTAQPEGNVAAGQAESFIRKVIGGFDALLPVLDEAANSRAEVLLESHIRVREASRAGGRQPVVEPFLPVDVLGLYVYLPT